MYREHLTLSLDGIRQLLSHLHGEITRLEADAAQMLLASKLDELTGLLRRGEFFKILEHKLVECRAEHIEVGIMMIDIDRFKSINDQLGHLTGDEVIKGVAKLLLTLDGPIVAAGRFGGEEFVVLVQGSMDQMAELAETIRNSTQALRGPIIGWSFELKGILELYLECWLFVEQNSRLRCQSIGGSR
jgi:diguanylate cyclase (GGDEF)-like protein